MTTRLRLPLLLGLLSANLVSSYCIEVLPGEFDALRQRYGEELAKTGEERKTFISKLNANYLISLEYYESGRRKDSDLDAMIAVDNEELRFEQHGTVKPSDIVRDPALLGVLQMRYIRSDAKYAGDFARREVAVHRRYISMLESLQREFAKATRPDDAALVGDEIARVRKLIPQEASVGDSVTLPSSLRKGLEVHLGFVRNPGLFDKRTATTIFDRSGERNHAKLEGTARWIGNGRIGGAIELGGGSDRIVSSIDTAGRGTVCAWFKPKKTLDSSTPQLEIVSTGGGSGLFVVNWARGTEGPKAGNGDNGAIDFSITSAEGAYSVCSTKTTEWRAGTWQFLCCSWDGKEQRLYVNGKLEGTRSQAHSHHGENLVIGSSEFEGTVDEVMKWSRALSESEVAELFRSTGG